MSLLREIQRVKFLVGKRVLSFYFLDLQDITHLSPPSREVRKMSPLRSDDSDSVRLIGGDTEGDFTVDSRTQTIVARRHATQLTESK